MYYLDMECNVYRLTGKMNLLNGKKGLGTAKWNCKEQERRNYLVNLSLVVFNNKFKILNIVGKSYTEELLDKWVQSPNPDSLMCDHIDEVDDKCSCPLSVTVSSKNSYHNWTFLIKTRKPLKAVALLQDTHRTHFYISSIFVKNARIEHKNDQEWISHLVLQDSFAIVEYRITVMFKTSIFGTFRQSVVFDFSTEPVLVSRYLCFLDINNCCNFAGQTSLCRSSSGRRTRQNQWDSERNYSFYSRKVDF